jgi:flagellar L-ring protein precursor FlgH
VGDIVTINVVETSKASKQATTQLKRDSKVGAGLAGLLGYQTSLGLKDDFEPESAIDVKYKSNYKGSGTTNRKDNMTAQISARVIQILPNGNLVIRGSREVTVNYEKQFIILQGVIRPEDITPENTVLSSYIADAKIEYKGKGDISRQQRKGWGSRFLDVIWPF